MKKYIKVNDKQEITDVFFDYQKNKFDGTEIVLEDVEAIKHKINGKSISDDVGTFIFKYVKKNAVEKSQSEIDIISNPIIEAREKEKLIAERIITNARAVAISELEAEGKI